MSNPKRLKKIGDTGRIEDPLKRFRLEVVSLITEKNWKDFVIPKLVGFGRLTFSKKLKISGRKNFSEYSDEEKVNIFISIDKHERVIRLDRILRSRAMTVSTLRNVYTKYIGPPKNLSREIILRSIISKFNDEELDIDKRKTEKQIINEEDIVNLFVHLNGIEVPKDILVVILSYLRYNSDLLITVGLVNKDFFITILSTWPHIFIRRKILYSISSLALRSCRTIIFNGILSLSELDFLFESLNPDRIRTISFLKDYSFNFIRLFFNAALKLKKKKNRYLFSRITNVYYHPRGIKENKSKKRFDWKSLDLFNIFPSLQEVHHPPTISLVNSGKLSSLYIKCQEFKWNGMKYEVAIHDSLSTLIENKQNNTSIQTSKLAVYNVFNSRCKKFLKVIDSFKKDFVFHLVLTNMRVSDGSSLVFGFLSNFQKLEYLKMELDVRKEGLQIFTFPILPNLRCLDLLCSDIYYISTNEGKCQTNFSKMIESVFMNFSNLETANIEIITRSEDEEIIDTLITTANSFQRAKKLKKVSIKIVGDISYERYYFTHNRSERLLEIGSLLKKRPERMLFNEKGVVGRKDWMDDTHYFIAPLFLLKAMSTQFMANFEGLVDKWVLHTCSVVENVFQGKNINEMLKKSISGGEEEFMESLEMLEDKKIDFSKFLNSFRSEKSYYESSFDYPYFQKSAPKKESEIFVNRRVFHLKKN